MRDKELEKASGKARLGHFTLNELLAVLFALLLLATLLAPTLVEIKVLYRQAECIDNLISLGRANNLYSADCGRFAPASPGTSRRWHGSLRDEQGKRPDVMTSPLRPYMKGLGSAMRPCPLFANTANASAPAPEKGGGGYGYNENVGSLRAVQAELDLWDPRCKASGILISDLPNPRGVVMFAETAAKANPQGMLDINGSFVEASMCKSYDTYNRGKPVWGTPEPTIHFRHSGKAYIVWCDGHISNGTPGGSKGDWSKEGLGFLGSRAFPNFVPRTPPQPEPEPSKKEEEAAP